MSLSQLEAYVQSIVSVNTPCLKRCDQLTVVELRVTTVLGESRVARPTSLLGNEDVACGRVVFLFSKGPTVGIQSRARVLDI